MRNQKNPTFMKSKSTEERVHAEFLAHTQNDVLAESHKLKNRFSHIWTYPSRVRYDLCYESYLTDLRGMTILDYGCGRGDASLHYLKQGAIVHGIDISPIYIDDCISRAKLEYRNERVFKFQVMDAHALEYADDTFDLIAGKGILHHLDAEIAMQEIHRVLKPGGRIILQEPLADNPLLKLFRLFTPRARTEDETPFSQKDLDTLIDDNLWDSESYFCGILEAPVAMLTSIVMPKHPQNFLLDFADKLEKWLHKKDYLQAWNQYILFSLVKR